MKDIKKVIEDLMRENTGAHLLDSGEAYGRHHEKNQLRNFAEEPYLFIDYDFFDISINLYWYLVDNLSITEESEKLNKVLYALSDEPQLQEIEEFLDLISAKDISWDNERPVIMNTYNDECMLSQGLQGCAFIHNDEAYVILQIHNGCDVRGSYTDARIFKCNDDMLFYNAGCCDVITERGKSFMTDEGYSWRDEDNNETITVETLLKKYKIKN